MSMCSNLFTVILVCTKGSAGSWLQCLQMVCNQRAECCSYRARTHANSDATFIPDQAAVPLPPNL